MSEHFLYDFRSCFYLFLNRIWIKSNNIPELQSVCWENFRILSNFIQIFRDFLSFFNVEIPPVRKNFLFHLNLHVFVWFQNLWNILGSDRTVFILVLCW